MAIVRRIPFAPHAALVVALLGRAIQPARADADSDLLKLPSLWIKTLDLQAGAGYKDNVLLRHQNLVSSPFLSGEVDGSLYRLPIDGWEYMFFASGEYDRYLNAPQINQEATVLIEGQVQKSFAQNWKAGVSAEYGYFDQVVDTSTVAELILPVPVQGNSFTIRPSIVRSFADGYGLELQLPGTRQLFNQFVDDYWQAGSRLILRREYGHKSELALFYEFDDRWHDTRVVRTGTGDILSGRKLQFYQHELGLTWRENWDTAKHWRTLTRLSLERNEDNGGGFYDFWRPLFSEQLRYRGRDWEVKLEARVSYYGYDRQRVAPLNAPVREKTYLNLSLRGEKSLTKRLKLYGQYEFERAISNLDLDDYTVHTINGGVGWEF